MRLAVFLVALILAGPVFADPCTRIPDRGSMPAEVARGRMFSGPVRYVGDGDSLCVETAAGILGAGWVEVRIADFNAPELSEPDGRSAREALAGLALGRIVRCVAGQRSYDRVVATCTLAGVSIGERLRRLGVRQGGR